MWLNDFFKNIEAKRLSRVKDVENLTKDLFSGTSAQVLNAVNKLKNSAELRKSILSEDASSLIPKDSSKVLKENKNLKEIFYHFFGMNNNWKWGRNLLGGFMVHSPEYPTYFIPAYTQASATGEAKDLKKGEGPRGIITGMLEGIAVGALVSGERLKLGEMIPYIILGAGLQLFSSKVFPWLGEKMGKIRYEKKMKFQAKLAANNTETLNNVTIEPTSDNPVSQNISMTGGFKAKNLHNNLNVRSLRI